MERSAGLQSLCKVLLSSQKSSARHISWIKVELDLGLKNEEGSSRVPGCVAAPHSVEKRSPAEGSGARPPVTLGRRERSGRLWMWDLSSFLTCVTLASFCLYSCRAQGDMAWHYLFVQTIYLQCSLTSAVPPCFSHFQNKDMKISEVNSEPEVSY